ncbi:MAG: formylglycine-generating enzyme family protein [Planctomycetes bacterium]|nr:formylglycine-generating enzyme family protein [Planctomycetota bacterium]
MVVVPAGSFTMGSPENEQGRSNDEGPQHRVTIARPFAAGKYEVTFDQWDACVNSGGCNGHRPSDEGWGRGNRPVINVSWTDAQAYVAWLSRRSGKRYRLLTEAEWEYAARGGTTTRYWCGDGEQCLNGAAWYSGNSGFRTQPVGGKGANAFGLHDMLGNVREWVEDCVHENYAGAPVDGSAWTSGGDCSYRVLRGGSWVDVPWFLRAALRLWNGPGVRLYVSGFRVARTD